MILIDRPDEKTVCDIEKAEKECFSVPWSAASIESELSYENVIFCAVNSGGEMAGYVIGQSAADEGELLRIAVLPKYRRQGVARSLMERFLEICKERELKQVFLEVRSSNAPAAALYESFGFVKIGTRKNYYDDPAEDADVYRFEISR